MAAFRVHQMLRGRTALARHEGGRRIYNVLPLEERRAAVAGYRVWHIGRPNDRPTRCVLLLRETGAGKTTFVNAALNFLFGVEFNDSFRLEVKDETEGYRSATESQTVAVTVYVIHHQPGMRHEYNCVLIDTPGLADTRGKQRQEAVRSCLEAFLTSEDAGVDELHCVGIVAKANVNRDLQSHTQMIREMISLFGSSVPDVTCVLATFATDQLPSVDAVMRNAGIRFTRLFPFDNGVLYTHPVNADTSDYAELFPIQWKILRKQHDAFFGYLATAPSVSTAVLRERKLFDINKKKLRTQIKEAATLMAAYYSDKDVYSKYELQEARNEGYVEQVKKVLISLKDPGKGLCAHNCRMCRQTCHECSGSVEEKAALAALCDAEAGAEVTRGLILVESATVTTRVAALVFREAAATGPEAASEGSAATDAEADSEEAAATDAEAFSKAAAAAALVASGAATGAVVAASGAPAAAGTVATASVSIPLTSSSLALISNAAAAAPPALAIASGAALGAVGTLGVAGVGYFVHKKLQKDPHSCDMDAKSGCRREDCRHSLSDHVRQDRVVKRETKYEKRTNKGKKEHYNEAVEGKREANEKINRGKQDILTKMTTISQTTVELLYHAKRTKELTLQKRDYVSEVMNHITSGSLQAGKDVTPHAVQLSAVVLKALQRHASSTAQQACGIKTRVAVEEMFLSIRAVQRPLEGQGLKSLKGAHGA